MLHKWIEGLNLSETNKEKVKNFITGLVMFILLVLIIGTSGTIIYKVINYLV